MRKTLPLLAIIFGGAIMGLVSSLVTRATSGQSNSNPTAHMMPLSLAQSLTRVCVPQTGAPTTLSCTNAAAATSSQLNSWTRYVIQCGDATYLRWGTASSVAAVNTDMLLPSGAWLEFSTESQNATFVSCLNKSNAVGCTYMECD